MRKSRRLEREASLRGKERRSSRRGCKIRRRII